MNDAIRAGAVMSLGRGFPWVARYLDAWWVDYEDGWLRVIDDHVAAELDEVAARLEEAAGTALGDSWGDSPVPGANTYAGDDYAK